MIMVRRSLRKQSSVVLLLIFVKNGIISSARLPLNECQAETISHPQFLSPDGLITALLSAPHHCCTIYSLLGSVSPPFCLASSLHITLISLLLLLFTPALFLYVGFYFLIQGDKMAHRVTRFCWNNWTRFRGCCCIFGFLWFLILILFIKREEFIFNFITWLQIQHFQRLSGMTDLREHLVSLSLMLCQAWTWSYLHFVFCSKVFCLCRMKLACVQVLTLPRIVPFARENKKSNRLNISVWDIVG